MAQLAWAHSADKHGVERADALHAMQAVAIHVRSFDESRIPGGMRPDLFIGPKRERTDLIEVMAIIDHTDRDAGVFHVMPLRSKTLDRARLLIAEGRRDARG
ncbi:hypothetical protein [Agromyces aerolatus]|uniref:hypothetical protein n=1 Tax=Agromyces sp. LY-1074 TaxID=3074080 RepID=UPI002856652E|nr:MULTISPECIES: hypothetical protein [unclassified Agromyces]MDR5698271.1 hypothetical protein [Agromyces sp. LY-1074]MDR5704565.1 hypothetical protein [Agromyces sp. LY-1358]